MEDSTKKTKSKNQFNLKDQDKGSYGLSKHPLRKLTWREACPMLDVSKEEYDQSTGLYQIGYSLTGLGGWNLFWEQVREQSKTFSQ